MIRPATDSSSPCIHVELLADGVGIRQHRPAVLPALAGFPVEQALQQVPRLLPICGEAQSIAAARAIEAARGIVESRAQRQRRERALWLEQALSAGWRISVDWPGLLDQPRDMAWLKSLRASDSEQAARMLANAVPGLHQVDSREALVDWAGAESGIAAQLIRYGREILAGTSISHPLLSGGELQRRARELLAHAEFDHLSPSAQVGEVGPLAMARDPLVAGICAHSSPTTLDRLMAQVLDIRAIQAGLGGQGQEPPTDVAWSAGDSAGIGCAMTARGPVFHRVQLDTESRVSQWRVMAPTDWHFAPGGPVAECLAASEGREDVAQLVVASFDPCAPCTVQLHGGR